MTVTDPTHEHGRSCWWDHLHCRWVCAPAPAVPAPAPASEPQADVPAEPVAAGH